MRLWKKFLFSFSFVAVVIWAVVGAEVSLKNIIEGVPYILEYLWCMVPPDTTITSDLIQPFIVTLQTAIVATVVSSCIALPISFFAAKNFMSNSIIYQVVRSSLGLLRGVPPLLYALLFVSMVGLGPFAGVLALIFHNIGSLGRYLAESTENVSVDIYDAAKAVGANKLKIAVYAVIPENVALIVGYILIYLEYSVRTSTILGLVGAGGIGLHLIVNIRLFEYGKVSMIMLLILTVIVIMDALSTTLRMRLIKG